MKPVDTQTAISTIQSVIDGLINSQGGNQRLIDAYSLAISVLDGTLITELGDLNIANARVALLSQTLVDNNIALP